MQTILRPGTNAFFFALKDDENFLKVENNKIVHSKKEDKSSLFQYIPKAFDQGILVFKNESCLKNDPKGLKLESCDITNIFPKEYLFNVTFETNSQ